MGAYRAYPVQADGRLADVHYIDAANDQNAIEKARQLVDGGDVELWRQDRFIGRITKIDFSKEKRQPNLD